jgi:hypothetical protein
MTVLTRLCVSLGLILLALSIMLSLLAGPMALLKRTGALKAARWLVRSAWRSLVGTVRLVARTRRLGIRRPAARNVPRRAG